MIRMSKIKHILLLKVKPDVTHEQIQQTFADIARLQNIIPGVEEIVAGPWHGYKDWKTNYTHGIVITFTSETARHAYITHEEHQSLGKILLTQVDDILRFDFTI